MGAQQQSRYAGARKFMQLQTEKEHFEEDNMM